MEFQIEYSVVFRKIEENNGYEWKWWVVESLFIYIKTKIATKSKQKREDREQSFYCSQTLLFWDSIKHIIHGDRDSFGIDEEYIGFLLLEKVQTVLTPSTKYLTRQYIDSLNHSHFVLRTNKSNSTKVHTQRLKIEAFECYNSFENYLKKIHIWSAQHTVVLRVFKKQIKNTIVTECIFWHRLERRWTNGCCFSSSASFDRLLI